MRPVPGLRLWWGLPVVVLLLVFSGAVTATVLPGLPEPPAVLLWVMPMLRFARDVTGFVTVGSLLIGCVMLRPESRSRHLASVWATVWLVVTVVYSWLTVVEVTVGSGAAIEFLVDTVLGRVLLMQTLAAAVCVVVPMVTGSNRWMRVSLVVAVSGSGLPGLVGHGGLTEQHVAASVSMFLHLAALSLWVGGLAVLVVAVLQRPELGAVLVPRFSIVALWSVLAVAETGLLNASMRAGTASALMGTWYGSLVLGKVVLLGVLVRFGWVQRQRVVPNFAQAGDRSRLLLIRYAGWEVLVMGVAIGVSVVLARIGPATAVRGAVSPVALSVITVLAPLLVAWCVTPQWRWARQARRAPEVPALVLAFAIVEIAGVGVLLPFGELGSGIGLLLLLAVGMAWAFAIQGERRTVGVITMMVLWPMAAWASGFLSDVDTGPGAMLLGVLLVEVVLLAVLALGRDRRPVSSPGPWDEVPSDGIREDDVHAG